jgi:hypothetical protein
MEKEFVTFKTAKLAKEKGFDVLTKLRYREDGSCGTIFNEGAQIMMPIQSLLQKWLREVHNIEVYVVPYSTNNNHKLRGGKGYYEVVVDLAGTTWSGYETYEEALEIGLQEALKLI